MAAALAVALPLALAIYSGWEQHKVCIGANEKSSNPVAENFCAGFRLSLNESCTAMLSVPLVGNQVKLNLGETITPIKFDDFTKETIRETYKACTDLWEDQINFRQYQLRLAQQASVLKLLFASRPELTANKKIVLDILAGQGASSQTIPKEEVGRAVETICQNVGGCGSSVAAPPPPPGRDMDFEKLFWDESVKLQAQFGNKVEAYESNVKAHVTAELAGLNAKLDRILENSVRVPDSPGNLTAEVAFATGDSTLRDSTCTNLASMIRHQLTSSSIISVVAYADSRGGERGNRLLSKRRAEQVAYCLTKKLALPMASIDAKGAGVLWTVPSDIIVARKAAIYIRELAPATQRPTGPD